MLSVYCISILFICQELTSKAVRVTTQIPIGRQILINVKTIHGINDNTPFILFRGLGGQVIKIASLPRRIGLNPIRKDPSKKKLYVCLSKLCIFSVSLHSPRTDRPKNLNWRVQHHPSTIHQSAFELSNYSQPCL